MSTENVKEEYAAALKEGQRECKELLSLGKNPYPAVLDEVLPEHGRMAVQELPAQELPVERIIGTVSAGRISALSASFMPLLESTSEFALKWMALCEAHLSDTGIRDPIQCYEYLGNFYVQEGNKRVSVLRHFGSTRILGTVKRVLPVKSEEPRVLAYYEFLEFYKQTGIYDLQFLKPGEYAKLLKALGKDGQEPVWEDEQRHRFNSRYHRFKTAFEALGGNKINPRSEDALLLWLQVYPYEDLSDLDDKALKESLSALWQDVKVTQDEGSIRNQPEEESKSLLTKLISPSPKQLKVAMIYQHDATISNWTKGHKEGAAYLSRVMPKEVTLLEYDHADNGQLAEERLEQAVKEGADIIFTTTPQLLQSTLKAAVKYPKVHFLNCSVGTNLSSVRSYYCRTYEGKFITGMIAGAMAKDDLIGYVGSYPILGVPASINAFALGARMTNPRARILLEWSSQEGSAVQRLIDRGARVISNRDVPVPNGQYMRFGEYGTFLIDDEGKLQPLGSPCWMWGKLYENVVRAALSGGWTQKKDVSEAITYWWGMDSGVIDVEMTDLVPEGIRALADSLMKDLREGKHSPFARKLVDQNGVLRNDGSRDLTFAEILNMDYLCDAVEGAIPEYSQLLPISRPLVRELGIHKEKLPPEEQE